MQLKIVEREWNEFRNSAASPDMIRRTPTFKRKAKFRSEFEALLSDVESALNSDSEDEMPVNYLFIHSNYHGNGILKYFQLDSYV